MELVRFRHDDAGRHGDCVAAIGNFDGVHLGHQAVLGELQRRAQASRLPATAITFEPYPREFLYPEEAPARLTNLREKVAALGALGIDRVVCLQFERTLAELDARAFVSEVLIAALRVRCIVVGTDFRFGRGRVGNFDLLRDCAAAGGCDTAPVGALLQDGERVSSSRIRDALRDNRLDLVHDMLGRPFSMRGRVVRGDGRGRRLGFATANVDPKRRRVPLHGIYAVRVHGIAPRALAGVASVGTRPVFDGDRWLLEVHLLDFDANLYGRHLQVEFVRWLRPELNFASVPDLQQAMREDVERARRVLNE